MVLLNRNRATTLMRQCGLDAIVATSPRHILYLSDYFCWLDPLFKAYMMRPGAPAELAHNFAVLPVPDLGEPALVLPAMWAANAADCWVDDIWLHGIGDLDLSAVPPSLEPSQADLLQRLEASDFKLLPIDITFVLDLNFDLLLHVQRKILIPQWQIAVSDLRPPQQLSK